MASTPVTTSGASLLPSTIARLKAELEVADAELKMARVKYQYEKAVEARELETKEHQAKELAEMAEKDSASHGNGSRDMPHPLN